ncbi:MAG: hypothetical protein WC356_05170 [Candidatus Micrarchaeia archaeon]|jgi:hypothetical protein
MESEFYKIKYALGWDMHYSKMDNSQRIPIAKKIKKLKQKKKTRHLHYGLQFSVDEVNQYRIVYKIFEKEKFVRIYFIGNHKQYEKWLRE